MDDGSSYGLNADLSAIERHIRETYELATLKACLEKKRKKKICFICFY